MMVQKTGGCNQMKCGFCKAWFCWICLQKVDSGTFPDHYQWWNLRGCANLQMLEAQKPDKLHLTTSKLLSIFQIIVLGIPSLLLTIISTVSCCCCFFAVENKKHFLSGTFSFWGNALTMILSVPFLLVLCFLAPLWCILTTIYLCLTNVLCANEGGVKKKSKDKASIKSKEEPEFSSISIRNGDATADLPLGEAAPAAGGPQTSFAESTITHFGFGGEGGGVGGILNDIENPKAPASPNMVKSSGTHFGTNGESNHLLCVEIDSFRKSELGNESLRTTFKTHDNNNNSASNIHSILKSIEAKGTSNSPIITKKS
jgi:hypothetical protein